jgi:exosome complex component RRP42
MTMIAAWKEEAELYAQYPGA